MRRIMALLIGCLGLPAVTLAVETVLIPEGPFRMGCSPGDLFCADDEGPMGGVEVNVPAFLIDRYEVTVDRYKRCVKAGACSEPKGFRNNRYCNYAFVDRGEHPVNCIDWQQAVDYCKSRSGRLPTEAEWEKAARAGSTSRYPWGQEVTCREAILDDGVTFGRVPNEPDGCGEDRTWPVGSREPNGFGLYDMHGNVGEWVSNWYAPNALPRIYAAGDLQGPDSSRQRVLRGGSWDEHRENLRSSFRNVKPPVSGRFGYGSIGFRCAYEP